MGLLIWIAVILFVLWILGVAVFNVAGFIIHVLLIAAVIAGIVWMLNRAKGTSV